MRSFWLVAFCIVSFASMLIYIILALAGVFLYFKYVKKSPEDYELLVPYYSDKCWTQSPEVVDTEIYPFKIQIEESQLQDLKKRLEMTRYPLPSLKDSKFTYGVNTKFMEKIVEYWKESYDWRKQEEELNKFPQFKTRIEGLDIHFIHVKPKAQSTKYKPKPLLLAHGWPGSVAEFYKIIPMLSDPTSHGGNETDLFEIIAPSIPGYGFSQAAEVQGFSSMHCARVFHKLMLRLGHQKYYAQGGDWGSAITTSMAMLYPRCVARCAVTLASALMVMSLIPFLRARGFWALPCLTLVFCSLYSEIAVRGLHVTMNVSSISPGLFMKMLLGNLAPSLFFDAEDVEKIYPLKGMFVNLLMETGYMHLQATKPDSVGFALSDSPVGLAAYILEKFSTWTDENGREKEDGDISKHWTYDELLTNVMIYWLNGNITSSMRLYKETFRDNHSTAHIRVRVPTGFAWFPNEFALCMKSQMERKYSRLLSFTRMKKGGHFNAFEVPHLLAEDIRNFVRKIESDNATQAFNEAQSEKDYKQTHLDRLSQ